MTHFSALMGKEWLEQRRSLKNHLATNCFRTSRSDATDDDVFSSRYPKSFWYWE